MGVDKEIIKRKSIMIDMDEVIVSPRFTEILEEFLERLIGKH